jgi:hypothetical protein
VFTEVARSRHRRCWLFRITEFSDQRTEGTVSSPLQRPVPMFRALKRPKRYKPGNCGCDASEGVLPIDSVPIGSNQACAAIYLHYSQVQHQTDIRLPAANSEARNGTQRGFSQHNAWPERRFHLEVCDVSAVSWPAWPRTRPPSSTCQQLSFIFRISFKAFAACYYGVPSLTRGRICNFQCSRPLVRASQGS